MEKETVAKRYGEICMTTNYSLFKNMLGNRRVNEVHVGRLMESFSHKQLIVPIIVTPSKDGDYMEIVDGQHRYEAARRSGKPVYYICIEGMSLEDCHILNANNLKYKPEDFMHGYIQLGYEEYKKVKDFRIAYPFLSMHLCMIYLSLGHDEKHGHGFKAFKEGKFKVKDYSLACLYAERTYDFRQFAEKFFVNRNFNTALLKLYMHPKYDHKKMMQKLSYQSGALKHQAKEEFFIMNILEIYNSRSRDDEKIYPHELKMRLPRN